MTDHSIVCSLEGTFAFCRLPIQHHKHQKPTNMLERVNQEIKRYTHVVRVFPNGVGCLRLVRALAIKIHEDWLEANRHLNVIHLKEHQRDVSDRLPGQRLATAPNLTGAITKLQKILDTTSMEPTQ